MTLNQLYKPLGQLIAKGHGRETVCIDKPSFTHPLEADGVVYQDISGVRAEVFTMCDGDGFTIINKDGSERVRGGFLLYGASGSPQGKTGNTP